MRDAVWAASPDYMWDASSWQGHMAFAYYRPSAIETWKDAADMSRMSIMEYSERWFQYPYPQISAVEGPISGMEYPMLAMENKSADKYELYNVVTHEIGHMWYPDDRRIERANAHVAGRRLQHVHQLLLRGASLPGKGHVRRSASRSDRETVVQYMQHNVDEPLEINPDRIDPQLLGENAYVKTAVGLALLRDEILGPQAFDDAFREYTRRWAFKHPAPADFFKTMEDVSGKRLDWFFREWFFENPHFDSGRRHRACRSRSATSTRCWSLYGNHARGVLPIHARFTFTDGSTQDFDYPAEVWSTNTTSLRPRVRVQGKEAHEDRARSRTSGSSTSDRTNNVWPR